MTQPSSAYNIFNTLRGDVSPELVDSLLEQQRNIGLFMRISLLDWDALRETHPNLSHYISATSHEFARGDPLQNERLAASLLGLCMLIDNDLLEKMTEHNADTSKTELTMVNPSETTDGYDADAARQPAA